MKNKTVAIYARVPTDKEKVDMQLSDLREYGAITSLSFYQSILRDLVYMRSQ